MENSSIIIKGFVSFAICYLSLNGGVFGQPRKVSFVWNSQSRSYVKAMKTNSYARTAGEKIVTSSTFVWVFPTPQLQGHWRRARVNEVKERARVNADYLYSISGYPIQFYNGPEKIDLRSIKEYTNFLTSDYIQNASLEGSPAGYNVYYARSIKLGLISLTRKQKHIIVADTLYLPASAPLTNAFISADPEAAPFLKVIAGIIIYESPVSLALNGTVPGTFIYSCDSLYFKSVYENMEPYELKPPPPVTYTPEGTALNVYRVANNELEINLLNRLYVKLMKQHLDRMAAASDDWTSDRLVQQFQEYRYRKIHPGNLVNDPVSQASFNQAVSQFESNYRNYSFKKLRILDGFPVIAQENDFQSSSRGLQYFTLPTIAQVQPLTQDSALGSVLFNGTGDAGLKLLCDVELRYDASRFATIAEKLKAKGVYLETTLRENTITIDAQPLKIGGRTVGQIIPVSNRILRFEVLVNDGSQSFATLFPKTGHLTLNVDVKAGTAGPAISMPVELTVDKVLLERLNYAEPFKSFHVVERTALTSDLKLSSALSSSRGEQGTLNYAEVMLDMNFGERSVLYGPYRLSAYNTLASELVVPFVKYTDAFRIRISGKAVYENGEVIIKSFETTSPIIVLDDAYLQ